MQISHEDRGHLYGDALFETMRVVSGELLWSERHRARMKRSARMLGFSITRVDEAFEQAVEVAATHQEEGLCRVTMSREPGPGVPFGGQGHITVRWRSCPAAVEGWRLGVEQGWYVPGDELSEHKTGNYMRSIVSAQRARQRGFDDALRLDHEGRVGECSASNVFVVGQGGEVVTPSVEGVLPGVMRGVVIELLREHGVEVEERALWWQEVLASREVWVTSMGIGVRSVDEVEGHVLREQIWAEHLRGWLIERGWR